ncbi:MAG: zinc ribbon domain-containing protein [Candidatus Heimdallarchaeaceae archaeon]
MSRKSMRYLNGLTITSIVFIILTAIPIGILAGVAYSNGDQVDQTLTLSQNEYTSYEIIEDNIYFINFWVEANENVSIKVFVLDTTQYNSWNKTEPIHNYNFIYEEHSRFIYLKDEVGYVVIYNNNPFDVKLTYQIVEIQNFIIPWTVLGSILSVFLTIMVLFTIGYIIKALIIVPITGTGRTYSYDYERRKDRKKYYEVPQERKLATPPKPPHPSGQQGPPKPPEPLGPPMAERPVMTGQVFVSRKPAIKAISENYVVAGQEKTYHPTNRFIRTVEKIWDNSSIAERIIIVIALFFFITGLVTVTWYNIFVMPSILVAIAIVIYSSGKTRREKLVRIVESYKAIYIRDAAKLLRTSLDTIRADAWKIIRLGLAPLGFDPENNVLFDITKVDPTKQMDLSPAAQTIHTQLISEIEKKEPKEKQEEKASQKELTCPFCEAINPPGSVFCIKCGASLRPAK